MHGQLPGLRLIKASHLCRYDAQVSAGPPAPTHTHSAGQAADPRDSAWPAALALFLGSLAVLLPLLGGRADWQGRFSAYFVSIVLQSAPYMLLGALIAGTMERFLPQSWLPGAAARLGLPGIPAAALLAPLFPSCECGIVSVGRTLLRKGLPLPHTLAYLLAGPILNPVVMLSTWQAFHDWRYPVLRAVGGFIVASLAGLLLRRVPLEFAFRPQFLAGLGQGLPPAAPVQPTPRRLEFSPVLNPLGANAAATLANPPRRARQRLAGLRQVLAHVRVDFLEMSVYFLFGVFIASAMKTFIPSSALEQLAHGLFSGPLAMMLTAFGLSLCSEADAFAAASFTEFSLHSKLAFLVLGPMLDIKLLMMYRSMFRSRFVAALAGCITLLVLAFALTIGVLN